MDITLPLDDQLELSVFGAGVGESLVVHLGKGDWMVVDSCSDDADMPIALRYLHSIGVDVKQRVKLVVVTHWHDDHVRGIAKVVDDAVSAEVVCSAALNSPEFFSLIRAANRIHLVEHTSGVSEFEGVLEILQRRGKGLSRQGPHHWATEHQLLYNSPVNEVSVMALSPSAATITAAGQRIGNLFPHLGPKRRLPSTDPNDLSVVLLVQANGTLLLLGGDLENSPAENRGWNAILQSTIRPQRKSILFKIAHHGSPNADNERIWSDLLHSNPISVVTPYSVGSTPRPSEGDITRIKLRTSEGYGAIPTERRPPRRRSVDRTIDEIVKTRRVLPWEPAHVRIRLPIGGQISDAKIELNGGARKL